jgi:diaminopimelate epimerase
MVRRFYKMTGSGNDFVVFDTMRERAPELERAAVIKAICERGTGVGADGIVLLESVEGNGARQPDFRMVYYNSDGSRASMCGNAGLCVTSLAASLGVGDPAGMAFESDAGVVRARLRDGVPEIELAPVVEARADAGIEREPGERRIGFALAGVPHLVVECEDADRVDVVRRGRALRQHPSLAAGANVNFLTPAPGGVWRIRTYERGVEGETLACGTGAVAAAVILELWEKTAAGSPTRLRTRSGNELTVRLRHDRDGWIPSLSGEGRLVFTGELPA